jgi:hypothetical protein
VDEVAVVDVGAGARAWRVRADADVVRGGAGWSGWRRRAGFTTVAVGEDARAPRARGEEGEGARAAALAARRDEDAGAVEEVLSVFWPALRGRWGGCCADTRVPGELIILAGDFILEGRAWAIGMEATARGGRPDEGAGEARDADNSEETRELLGGGWLTSLTGG